MDNRIPRLNSNWSANSILVFKNPLHKTFRQIVAVERTNVFQFLQIIPFSNFLKLDRVALLVLGIVLVSRVQVQNESLQNLQIIFALNLKKNENTKHFARATLSVDLERNAINKEEEWQTSVWDVGIWVFFFWCVPASHAGEPRASGSGIRRVSAWILHAAQCAGVYFESRNISLGGAIYCWKMDGLSTALVRHVKPTFMEHNWPRIRCVAACLQVDMNHQVHWHCEWTNWCVIGKAMDHRSHRSLLFFCWRKVRQRNVSVGL